MAVITGGASGLAAAAARRLAADGVHAALVDIEADGAARVAGELETPVPQPRHTVREGALRDAVRPAR